MCLKSSLHMTFLPQSHSVIQQILLSVLGSWDTSMKKTAQNVCPYGTYTPAEGIRQNKRGSRRGKWREETIRHTCWKAIVTKEQE